jgi:hypothetical protein
MLQNWYAHELIASQRHSEDLKAAEQHRMIKEALSAYTRISLGKRMLIVLAQVLLQIGSWLQQKIQVGESIQSVLESQKQDKRACAPC